MQERNTPASPSTNWRNKARSLSHSTKQHLTDSIFGAGSDTSDTTVSTCTWRRLFSRRRQKYMGSAGECYWGGEGADVVCYGDVYIEVRPLLPSMFYFSCTYLATYRLCTKGRLPHTQGVYAQWQHPVCLFPSLHSINHTLMTQPTGPYTAIQPTSPTMVPATVHDDRRLSSARTQGHSCSCLRSRGGCVRCNTSLLSEFPASHSSTGAPHRSRIPWAFTESSDIACRLRYVRSRGGEYEACGAGLGESDGVYDCVRGGWVWLPVWYTSIS